jgi:ribose transport system permease protein
MRKLRELLRERTYAFALAFAVLLLAANLAVLPRFGSPDNIPVTLALFAPFALTAAAATPAIVTGGMDISVAAVAGLVNNLLVLYLLPGPLAHPAIAILITMVLGTSAGLLNGFAVAVLRYRPVIATLCSLLVLQGVNQKIARTPAHAPSGWPTALAGSLGPVPGALVLLAVPLLVWLAIRRTPLHRTLLAVGSNDVAAHAAGVNVAGVRVLAYGLGGLLAAVAGIAMTASLQTAAPDAGAEFILASLAAVVLGGTAIGGGRGGIAGAFAGAAVIFLIQNLLGALEVNAYWNQVAYGLMLLAGGLAGAQLKTARNPGVSS